MKAEAQTAWLVEQARRGDAGAFAALIRRTERTALAVAYAACGDAQAAADAVQEAFLKAWQKLRDLENADRFIPWLCGIVRNAVADQSRRLRPEARESLPATADAEADPALAIVRAERSRQIDDALRSMDDESRAVVVLRYYEGLSSREIGEALGISTAAVDMRLSRARQQMRARLAHLAEELRQPAGP